MTNHYLMCVGSDRHTKGSCKSKVSKFNNSMCIDQEVLRFEISVKHPVTVTELDTLQYLICVALCKRIVNS